MPVWSIVLLTILVILLVVFIALIIVGNKLRKKQESQQEQIDAAKQIMSMLVIDKKKMKLKEAGLPKNHGRSRRILSGGTHSEGSGTDGAASSRSIPGDAASGPLLFLHDDPVGGRTVLPPGPLDGILRGRLSV